MDLGKFKRTSEDEDDAWASWLGEESSDSEGHSGSDNRQNRHRPTSAANKSQVKLTDDFQHPRLKHRQNQRTTSRNTPETAPIEKTIAISLQLPRLRLPHYDWRRLRPWGIGVVVVVTLLVGGNAIMNRQQSNAEADKTDSPVIIPAELGYRPLTPPTRADGSKAKSSFDDKRDLYTFMDTYMDANITVNQQAMPENLKNNTKNIAALAASFDAKEKFTSTVGEVYLYTDETVESQRLMVINDKMLMFAQSTKRLAAADWIAYLQSLE